jgi:hypothetical protein
MFRVFVLSLIVFLSGCKSASFGLADIHISYKPDNQRQIEVGVEIYR